MQYVKAGHMVGKQKGATVKDGSGAVLRHIYANNGTWYLDIEKEDYDRHLKELEHVTVDVPLGSCIIFSGYLPHRSLPNTTEDLVRFSIDMRWQDFSKAHGMGRMGGLIKLRSADPNFKMDYDTQGAFGEIPRDANGKPVPLGKDDEHGAAEGDEREHE